eukprot:537155-Pyramimonas_sp.AAC.1
MAWICRGNAEDVESGMASAGGDVDHVMECEVCDDTDVMWTTSVADIMSKRAKRYMLKGVWVARA